MRRVPVQDAVGMVLGHDVTRIVPGEFKGRAFARGHVIQREDIPDFLCLGKEHIYVMDVPSGWLHEEEAALRIARAAAGAGIRLTPPAEGRINFETEQAALLKINLEGLLEINAVEGVALATLHGNQAVEAGQKVAGTRVIPLIIEAEKVLTVESIALRLGPVVTLKPFKPMDVAVIVTGSEVVEGRIEDAFTPVLEAKLAGYGSRVVGNRLVRDRAAETAAAIQDFARAGADMILVTGGMSVDPDDVTPAGIRASGADVLVYGAPVFPGVMFMAAYLGKVPVLGLPGCVMYYRASIFDLVLPRFLAGERPTRADFLQLAYGGFCNTCETCRYPRCAFGKGAAR